MSEQNLTQTAVGADLNAYRDPEVARTGGKKRKRRMPTDWLNDRREGRGERALVPDVEVSPHDSYYGRNVVKAPPWGPQIPTYLFFGGLAGGSQLLATGAYLAGNKPLQRITRLTTAVGVTVSGLCLIEDLGRPERFYNMMRVAKLSSPMSVGTWVLSGFSAGAMPLAALEAARMLPNLPLPKVSGPIVKALDVAEAPSVAAGALFAGPLAAYTSVLLTNTSMPTWAAGYKYLPFVFTGSACAASGGNAMVWTPVKHAAPARRLAVLGAAADLVALHKLEQHLDDEGVAEPLHTGTPGKLNKASMALNIAGIATTVAFGRTRVGSIVAGAAFAAGSACTRFAVFGAGMNSAKDPKYTIDPQRRRLAKRQGQGNITTVPLAQTAASVAPGLSVEGLSIDDAPRTADGRRPLPGPDGRPSNL